MMKNVGENIRQHLQKNLEALHRFEARKTTFMTAREQITREIEETRSIWLETLEQLPHQEFSKKKEKITRPQPAGSTNLINPLTQKRTRPLTYKRINPLIHKLL